MNLREETEFELYKTLRFRVEELRKAQRDYMKNRGDDALGKIVAEKATRVDEALDVIACFDIE